LGTRARLCPAPGANDSQADDLTQGFFAALLDRGALAAADRDRGRFRGFLLTSVKYYPADQWDRDRARKRGGGDAPISLDDTTRGQPLFDPPDGSATPDREYDRQWALAVLDLVRQIGDDGISREGSRCIACANAMRSSCAKKSCGRWRRRRLSTRNCDSC
jgi:hypothetical protein